MPKNIITKFSRRAFIGGSVGAVAGLAIANRAKAAGEPVLTVKPVQPADTWQRLGSVRRKVKAVDHAIDFPETEIAPGETKVVQVQPQCLFRGDRVLAVCPGGPGELEDLVVLGFFVGKKSQFATFQNPLSLSAWSNIKDEKFDTCDKALTMTAQIKNVGDCTRRVKLSIFGKAVL